MSNIIYRKVRNLLRQFFLASFVIIFLILTSSCSAKICPAYARSTDKTYPVKKMCNSGTGALAAAAPLSEMYNYRLYQR